MQEPVPGISAVPDETNARYFHVVVAGESTETASVAEQRYPIKATPMDSLGLTENSERVIFFPGKGLKCVLHESSSSIWLSCNEVSYIAGGDVVSDWSSLISEVELST